MAKPAGKRKGGLKSALVSLQSRISAQSKSASVRQVQETKAKAVKRKIAGHVLSKQTTGGRLAEDGPFVSHSDNTLLIGEGNFSFTLSLVQHHGIPAHRLTATTYDTEEQLFLKYPETRENLATLRDLGVTVVLHVDARALDKNKSLMRRCKRLGGFSRVVWNFPHAGAGIQDQDRNIQVNQQLLLSFFRSVAAFLSTSESIPFPNQGRVQADQEEDSDVEREQPKDESGGRVLITLRNCVPYTLWEVPKLAKRPPPGHPVYRQLRSYSFDPATYPGYEHRRTIGTSVDLLKDAVGEEGSGHIQSCRTWEFIINT